LVGTGNPTSIKVVGPASWHRHFYGDVAKTSIERDYAPAQLERDAAYTFNISPWWWQ